MVGIDTISSLRQSVERVVDPELKNEMLGKVAEVHDHLVTAHERLHAKQSELDNLRAQLSGNPATAMPATDFYDPPV